MANIYACLPPKLLITIHVKNKLYCFMVSSVIGDEHGLCNEMYPNFLLKTNKAILTLYLSESPYGELA